MAMHWKIMKLCHQLPAIFWSDIGLTSSEVTVFITLWFWFGLAFLVCLFFLKYKILVGIIYSASQHGSIKIITKKIRISVTFLSWKLFKLLRMRLHSRRKFTFWEAATLKHCLLASNRVFPAKWCLSIFSLCLFLLPPYETCFIIPEGPGSSCKVCILIYLFIF